MKYHTFKEYIQHHLFDDKDSFNNLLDALKHLSKNEIISYFNEEPDFLNYSERDMIVMATRVHHLCIVEYRVKSPRWVLKKKYYSNHPIFPKGVNGMLRAILAVESPTIFKSHGVFVSANALRRV